MRVRPVRLNAAIAWLFMVGASCFVLGSVPAYARAVGGVADAVTYVVGSIFFTSASYSQLVQAQSPGMLGVDAEHEHRAVPVHWWGWLPHDRGWLAAVTQFPGTVLFNVSTGAVLVVNATAEAQDRHVWRPDFFGSTLFLISSTYGVLALGFGFLCWRPRSLPWWVAVLNMLGSVFFMWSALASFVLPSTDELIDPRASVGGTLLGAVCFLVGAGLMLPAWRRDVAGAAETAA